VKELLPRVSGEFETIPARTIAGGTLFTEKAIQKIVIIEKRTLISECLAQSLRTLLDAEVTTFSDVQSWKTSWDGSDPAVILVGGTEGLKNTEDIDFIIGIVCENFKVPVVFLCDAFDRRHMLNSMRHGVHGFIPTTSTTLEVAIEAIRLVLAGGRFLPPESILGDLKEGNSPPLLADPALQLTAREKTIVEALRTGKQNKQISYFLNLSENTVRVHLRNIMKKLNAKNRTEVVAKLFDRN
jgi:DNA-binding NarL/FixJ family response regulator